MGLVREVHDAARATPRLARRHQARSTTRQTRRSSAALRPAGIPHQPRSQSITVSSTVDGPDAAIHDVPRRLKPDDAASASAEM